MSFYSMNNKIRVFVRIQIIWKKLYSIQSAWSASWFFPATCSNFVDFLISQLCIMKLLIFVLLMKFWTNQSIYRKNMKFLTKNSNRNMEKKWSLSFHSRRDCLKEHLFFWRVLYNLNFIKNVLYEMKIDTKFQLNFQLQIWWILKYYFL